MIVRTVSVAVVLLISSHAFAGTYLVSPNGNDGNNGVSSPWLTIQHAIDALPAGDQHNRVVSGDLFGERGVWISRKRLWANLTIKSKDPANPAVITSADDKHVISLAGDIDIKSLTFRDVTLDPSKAARLALVDVRNLKLAFDHCSLSANSALLETTERASEVKIDFLNCKIKSDSQGLIVKSAETVSFKKCALAWNKASFVQGPAASIVFDGCSVDGPDEAAQFFSFAPDRGDRQNPARSDKHVDLLQVSDCEGTCGRLLWELGGVRRLLVTGNRIQWKYTGRVIGAGPEISWSQKAPLHQSGPFREDRDSAQQVSIPRRGEPCHLP